MRVAVVGGGVIGLSVAWQCAVRGAQVTLIDPAPGAGASWVAGGMLAPVAEAYRGEEHVTALGLASMRLWPAFVADLAGDSQVDPGYTTRGTLVVARDGDDAAQLSDLFALQQGAGLEAERLTSREARRLEPALGPAVRGALWLPDDHQVDNRLLLRSLAAACVAVGVGFVSESASLVGAGAVTVESGVVIAADAVVLASGARVPPVVVADEPVSLPVRPVKGQIVRVRATTGAVFPTRTVRGLDVYIVPRAHGEIAIGATSEERGFDTTVTAGAVLGLLRDAWELIPGLAEAELVEAIAGSRPGTPDNAPLIGRWRDGPIVATGHYRHGVLLAPVTAAIVTSLVFDGDAAPAGPVTTELLAAFDPTRFAAVPA